MPIKLQLSPFFQVLPTLFEVPTQKSAPRMVDPEAARKALNAIAAGRRAGCYIFAIRKGKNKFEPWYVGKTSSSFAQEALTDINCLKYAEALALAKTGNPVMLFICPPPAKGPLNTKAIDKLETMLVEECGGINSNIRNKRKATIYRTVIHGVVNSKQGKPPPNAMIIRKLMGRD